MSSEYHLEPVNLPGKLKPQALTLYLVRRATDDDSVTRKLAKALRLVCG